MRIALICIDSRGGTQPYLALGIGLKAAGHDILVIAPENFEALVTRAGLAFLGVRGDLMALLLDPKQAGVAEGGFWRSHVFAMKLLRSFLDEWMPVCHEACDGYEVLLGGFGGSLVGESVGEKLGIPFVQAHVQPWSPTRAFAGLLTPGFLGNRVAAFNILTHHATQQVFWQPVRSAINAARKKHLSLPAVSFFGNIGKARKPRDLILYGYSEQVIPTPPDMPKQAHVTGYWFADTPSTWQPPADLIQFLRSGEVPIAVGFGSMSSKDAAETTRIILSAVKQVGGRAILLSGWGGLSDSNIPENVYCTDAVPHDWLFPQVSLSVHHGGAGTTGATLRAGIPAVIVPFAADQPFWGRVVDSLGLGYCRTSRRRLTAGKLADQISTALSNQTMRDKAIDVGQCVRQERGVDKAVQLLEQHCADWN